MSFDTLASEIVDHIIDIYRTDILDSIEDPFERLEQTLLLLQITGQCREVALAHKALWTDIYLQWPLRIVDFYRHQSRLSSNPEISVYLDTAMAESGHKKKKERKAYWANFFEQEMKRIVSLDVHVCTGQVNLAIAAAISQTPAPCLQKLTLDFDEDVTDNAGIHSLFDRNAPKLHYVHLFAAQPIILQHFETLETLDLRVGHHNIVSVFAMLNGCPNLRTVGLTGVWKWMAQFLPDNTAPPINLEACTHFALSNLNSYHTDLILSRILLPQLEDLVVKETMHFANNVISTTFFLVLERLSHPAQLRDWLHLGLHPHHFVIRTRGWHYDLYWEELPLRDAPRLVRYLARILSVLASSLNLQPVDLMIETYIVARKRDKKFPAYLIDDDLHTLLLQIYKLWTSVTSLHVVGNATAILRALCNPHDILLPNLHTITFVQLYGDTTTTCDGKGRAKILDHRYVEFEEQQFPEGLVMDTEQL